MQQSMKPFWVRGGSSSQVPNLEVISEFQLSIKMMALRHTNMEMIHPVHKFQLFMSHIHYIFSGNLVYMPSIWCERYLWHSFCSKLGQVMDLVLFSLWPCNMVIKIYQPGTCTLEREDRLGLGLKVLYGDTRGCSSVPALPPCSL